MYRQRQRPHGHLPRSREARSLQGARPRHRQPQPCGDGELSLQSKAVTLAIGVLPRMGFSDLSACQPSATQKRCPCHESDPEPACHLSCAAASASSQPIPSIPALFSPKKSARGSCKDVIAPVHPLPRETKRLRQMTKLPEPAHSAVRSSSSGAACGGSWGCSQIGISSSGSNSPTAWPSARHRTPLARSGDHGLTQVPQFRPLFLPPSQGRAVAVAGFSALHFSRRACRCGCGGHLAENAVAGGQVQIQTRQ